MSVTRRSFLVNTTYAGAGLAVAGAIGPLAVKANASDSAMKLAPYLSGLRMSTTPATAYRAYRSKVVTDPNLATWVQIDLNKSLPIEMVQLLPAAENWFPGRDQYYAGEGFPLRFKIEASDEVSFKSPTMIADLTQADFPDVTDNITQYKAKGVSARYVRLTATRLRPIQVVGGNFNPVDLPVNQALHDGPDFTLTLAKISVISGGQEVSVGCKVAADEQYGNTDLLSQLTRAPRQDGEGIIHDNPQDVTHPSTWKAVESKAHAPRTGVKLDGGVFEIAVQNNIDYLLNSYSTDDLLRQFYERTGKIKDFKGKGGQIFWEEDLAGSNAGRFLMGAANAIRWVDNAELKRRVKVVVDGIEECKQPNGYIMAYPEDTILVSERGAYTRAWLTHGLLEAAYSGNEKALPMLRGYYDWFNKQSFLPELHHGAVQGGQGAIANTRMATSPVGKAADAQVFQRYFQEDAWIKGLAKRDKEQIWQYPYDRPHCYLLTNLEAYLDMYLVTGDPRYYEAVLGGWELYRAHWQQAGGSISIIEMIQAPPDSNYLHKELGELCGNSFWIFLSQRFHQLHPDDERFATEIEKSIYNVAMANQDGGKGIRYHAILEGKKNKESHENTCCEGQGTRMLGSLPEHIYMLAGDGVYVNLFEPSTISWKQDGHPIELTMKTHFPFDTAVQCTVKTSAATKANVRVRVPSWASGEMSVKVNGKVAGVGNAGSYVQINRHWSNEDVIEFTLPATFRLTRYEGEDQIAGKSRYAIEYGPILMAAVGSSKVDLVVDRGHEVDHLAAHFEPIAGSPLHFSVRGNKGQKLMPYWQVAKEEFTCFPTVTVKA